MKKAKTSKLISVLLVLAMLVPGVLTVPASAQNTVTEHYTWTAFSTGSEYEEKRQNDAAALKSNTRFENNGTQATSMTHWYALPTFYTVGSAASRNVFCFSNSVHTTHGLPYETLPDGRVKATEGLKIELAQMSPIAIGGEEAAVALTMDYVWFAVLGAPNSGIDGQLEVYVSVSEPADGQYTYLPTPARVQSSVYQGAGSYVNGGQTKQAHLYRITSENLLDIPGVSGASSITSIMIKPYGSTVPSIGSWGIASLKVEGFATSAAFNAAYPETGVGTVTVPEDVLRSIVAQEARKVSQFEWTPAEDVLALCPIGASGYAQTAVAMLYKAGTPYRGPIYSRDNDGTYERLLNRYTRNEDGSYTYPVPYDVDGDGSINYADTFGMDCASFVFNALSRVSAGTNAWAVVTSVDDHKLVPLSGLTVAENPAYTDTDIIQMNTDSQIYAAYAALEPGDVVLNYDAGSKVHTRIVSAYPVLLNAQGQPVDNAADCDPDKSYVPCHEEHCSTVYHFAHPTEEGSTVTMKVETYAAINTTNNSLSGSTVEQEIAEARAKYNEKYAALCAQYGVDELTLLYGQSARTDEPYTFTQLKNNLYAPFTLTDYVAGRVEQGNVNIVAADPQGGTDYTEGLRLGISSNYRIISVDVTLANSDGTTIFTDTGYSEGTYAFGMFYSNPELDALLAQQAPGCYTLTVSVSSGPVTVPGGQTPVTTRTIAAVNHTSFAQAPATLTGGHYYLDSDFTATVPYTVNGDVTLCLHGHTLSNGITGATASAAKRLFTVSGGTLTICDCVGGGRIYSDGDTFDNVSAVHVGGGTSPAKLELKGGTIEGFKRSGGGTGGVFLTTNGSFDLYGGTIKNCTGKYAGAVYLYNSSTMNMYGGEISGNHSLTFAGGVFVEKGVFKLYGGSIAQNAAVTNGGGVYVGNNSGTRFEMRGGQITGNTAVDGAGVYNKYVFHLYDGCITGNTATGNGGGLWSNTTQCHLYGGVISENAAVNGGGIYSLSKIDLNDGAITDNIATTSGGGVYFSGANGFVMNDGVISGNRAKNGGGISLNNTASVFTMRGGIIGGDTPDQANILVGTNGAVYGNAIYVGTATANLYGGDIAGNISDNAVTVTKGDAQITAASGNGAVWVSTGTVVLGADPDAATTYTGARIYGNKGRYAGGIWINGAGTLTMTGGAIGMDEEGAAPNTVNSGSAAAFYIYGSGASATISGGQINGGFVNAGTLSVSGGKFSHSPAAWLADGYQLVEIDEDGLNYSVVAG